MIIWNGTDLIMYGILAACLIAMILMVARELIKSAWRKIRKKAKK